MSKIKIVEESRFLSAEEMNVSKGGDLTCGVDNVYHACNDLAFTTCGANFNIGQCLAYVGCSGYASCGLVVNKYFICDLDSVYRNINGGF